MKRILFFAIAIVSLSLVSCGPENYENASKEDKSELILFYPDGTKDTIEVFDAHHYSSSECVYYKLKDGSGQSTTLPHILND